MTEDRKGDIRRGPGVAKTSVILDSKSYRKIHSSLSNSQSILTTVSLCTLAEITLNLP